MLRPQSSGIVGRARRGSLRRLHQRQLRRRVQAEECLHLDAGSSAADVRRLLAHGVGAAVRRHRHDDALS